MEYTARPDEETLLDSFDQLLAPVVANLFANRPKSLAVIAGADILSDIWNAVSSLLSFPSGFYNWMQSNVGGALNWITSTTGNIKDFIVARVEWVANNIVLPAINAVSNVVSGIPGAVSAAASWVWNQVQPALNAGWDFVSSTITWLLQQVQAGLTGIGNFIQSTADWLWQRIVPIFEWVGTQVSNGVNWLWSQIAPIFNYVATQVGAGINWLWDHIVPIFDWVTSRVGESATWVAGQTFNYVIQGAAALGDGFQNALDWLMHGAFGDFTGTINRVINVPAKMLNGSYHGLSEILADLDMGNDTGGFARFMYSLCAFIPTLASLAVGLGPIYAADALQNANRIVSPTLLSYTDTRDAWLRGLITDAQLDEEFQRMGFDTRRRTVIGGLFYEPAPPSDLVRFLVREVFDPQLRQSLALDSEYPAAADAEARKVGLSPETMRNYWAAHWNLPSPGQVYEMLHRGLINAADVDQYLKVADFSPAWRRNLANISYNVPGRIDLRRMFHAGVINEDRVLKGYKDLGYTDTDAAALTALAKKLASGTPKELPRGVILEAYRDGESDRNEARTELEAMGFAADDVALMLDLEDLTNAKKLQSLNEDIVEADLKAGIINEAQALTTLSAQGVPARRAQLLVSLWRSRHAAKTFTLSVSHIQQAVREKLIPDAVALQRFAALGVNAGDAQLLLALAHPQAPADAPPALTLSHLFRSLREGLLTPAQLKERLDRKGYSAEDVRLLIDLATPDLAAPEPAELTKAELIAAAKGHVLPIDAVQRRLAAKGYSAQDVDTILRTAKFEFTPTGQLVSYPRRDLTVAQLSKSFATGLMDEKQFRFRLAELAYDEADIDLLVDLATPAAPNG